MKQLYLIRHAKSSWSDASLADIDRPLNKRGKRDAPFMGRRLHQAGVLPDLMIASPAKRAQKTARAIARQIGYKTENIVCRDDIYTSDLSLLLRLVGQTEPWVESLALVGHNHVITEFAEWLTGEHLVNIPTCGIVAVEFDTLRWDEIKMTSGKMLFYDFPKLHANTD